MTVYGNLKLAYMKDGQLLKFYICHNTNEIAFHKLLTRKLSYAFFKKIYTDLKLDKLEDFGKYVIYMDTFDESPILGDHSGGGMLFSIYLLQVLGQNRYKIEKMTGGFFSCMEQYPDTIAPMRGMYSLLCKITLENSERKHKMREVLDKLNEDRPLIKRIIGDEVALEELRDICPVNVIQNSEKVRDALSLCNTEDNDRVDIRFYMGLNDDSHVFDLGYHRDESRKPDDPIKTTEMGREFPYNYLSPSVVYYRISLGFGAKLLMPELKQMPELDEM
ncbi:hypothetical protein [Pseudothermotoga thermarum]|uniref:Uncharacterized protein n=1 Tax=Pseudothermotoga thermarum DSM 5069 TaxID=688269 RepID=F7YTK4_9THEM|nr:hypothetical protein [Pseudothermotoga thermarum]AEH51226.1 hypothetical protein Theth_1152 [Pseudothermotoga thermarum DSM 5069]